MILKQVKTQTDAEELRKVKNSVSSNLTEYNEAISKTKQKDWFAGIDHSQYFPYLFNYNGSNLGYGTINIKDQTPWINGAIKEIFRGNGYGNYLFMGLVHICKEKGYKSVNVEVDKDNAQAIKILKKLSFSTTAEKDSKIILSLTL